MKYLYKYPQNAYPYSDVIEENRRRGRNDPEYELLDTGIFDEDRCSKSTCCSIRSISILLAGSRPMSGTSATSIRRCKPLQRFFCIGPSRRCGAAQTSIF
jgi:hypothetical protein